MIVSESFYFTKNEVDFDIHIASWFLEVCQYPFRIIFASNSLVFQKMVLTTLGNKFQAFTSTRLWKLTFVHKFMWDPSGMLN